MARYTEKMVPVKLTLDEKTWYCGSSPNSDDIGKIPFIVTHLGRHHADEIFGIVILLLGPLKHKDTIYIVRNRDRYWQDKGDYVIDVGGIYDPNTNRYDHHHHEFDICYPDGTLYASAGLIWLKYGISIVKDICDKVVDPAFITPSVIQEVHGKMTEIIKRIDNADNGQVGSEGVANVIGNMITNANPTRHKFKNMPIEYNKHFLSCLLSIYQWFDNYLETEILVSVGDRYLDEVSKSSDSSEYLFIPQDIPWKDMLWSKWDILDKYKLIISSSEDEEDTWVVHSLPIHPGRSFSLRCPAPIEIRGMTTKDIYDITGIDDVKYCHKNGFVTYCNSKESAIAMARYIINRNKEEATTINWKP